MLDDPRGVDQGGEVDALEGGDLCVHIADSRCQKQLTQQYKALYCNLKYRIVFIGCIQ